MEDSQFFVHHQLDLISNRLLHLFFAYNQSIALLQDFPEVLLTDYTYKINRFKIPLLNIVGIISLNSNFHFGFTFLSQEAEEDFTWVLK